MTTVRKGAACILAAFVSMLLFAGPALATPGNGNGNGQDKSSEETSEASSDSTESSSPGNSGHAPGKQKKDDQAAESSDSSGSGSKSSGSGSKSSGSGSKSSGSGSKSSGSGSKSSGANSPAPEDSSQGKPVHGCDQADAGYTHDYASTCDGSPSKNGNGGGDGKGKPCAGCVGAADNKNPPGQSPNGSDHNNGYECDGNNGVGKTNPAHTGCSSTTPPPPPPVCDGDINTPGIQPCVPPPPPPPVCDADINTPGIQPCVPPPPPVCDADINMPGIQPCNPDRDEDDVLDELIGRGDGSDSVLDFELRQESSEPAGAILPQTGVQAIAPLILSGIGLIGLGLVTLRGRRRR